MEVVEVAHRDDVPAGAVSACLGFGLSDFAFMLTMGGEHRFGPKFPTEEAARAAALDYAAQQQVGTLYWIRSRYEGGGK